MNNRYNGLYITDASGNVFYSLFPDNKELKNVNISETKFFQTAKDQKNQGYVYSKINNELVSNICAPVISDSGNFIGSFVLSLKASCIIKPISGKKLGNTGYGFMINNKGIVNAHPVPKYILSLDLNKLKGPEK